MMKSGTRKLGKIFSGQTSIGALVMPPGARAAAATATAKSNRPAQWNQR